MFQISIDSNNRKVVGKLVGFFNQNRENVDDVEEEFDEHSKMSL